MPPEASTVGSSGGRELRSWLLGVVVVVAVLLGALVAMGGRVGEAATWGLVVAAGAMVFALRALYGMAMALARPPIESTLEQEDVAAVAGARELREERRRVLRAINELRFDYEMGKLSDEDYAKVREGYELRAVEVMRALESESSLHPRLAADLRYRGLLEDEEASEAGGSGDAKAKADADVAEDASEAGGTDEEASEAEGVAAGGSGEAEADSSEAAAGDSEADGSETDEAAADERDEKVSADADGSSEAATMTCGACEGANDPDAKFCKHCGAELGGQEASA